MGSKFNANLPVRLANRLFGISEKGVGQLTKAKPRGSIRLLFGFAWVGLLCCLGKGAFAQP